MSRVEESVMSLEGKVVLISGAGNGMGASHARAVVGNGGSVVMGDVDDEAGTALVSTLGERARYVHLDVRDNEQWSGAVELAESEFGALTSLVNNAGVFRPGGVEDCSDEDWEFILAINLTGAFQGIRAAVPALKRNGGGSIVNVSSTAGLKGFAGAVAYGASKWGLRGLTKDAAIDLATSGIRVNSVHPGNIATRMIDDLYPDFRHVLQNRAGDPEEISQLVLFLLSDASTFSTGSEFVADGGETAGIPADPAAE
jgi:3alpha(or 20beta)-hydroxysteroid dehydrogenase